MSVSTESVYNLLPQQQTATGKQQRYKSKHVGVIDPHDFEMGVKDVQGWSTFGRPDGTYASSPDNFTHSHTGSFHQTRRGNGQSPAKTRLKDPLPAKGDAPVMGLWSGKDFLKTNALDVIKARPHHPEPEFNYTQKPDFGRVPDYLVEEKKRQEATMARSAELKAQQAIEANRVAPLAEESRQELLAHLKLKWAQVNTNYQKLPFSMDSASKCTRKEALERELASIEADIRLLARGNIMVAQDM